MENIDFWTALAVSVMVAVFAAGMLLLFLSRNGDDPPEGLL